MCVESAQSVSLVAVVCGPDVGVVCHHEVVLSQLVAYLVDCRAIVDLRHLRQVGCLQEGVISLRFKHTVQFAAESDTHLVDLALSN